MFYIVTFFILRTTFSKYCALYQSHTGGFTKVSESVDKIEDLYCREIVPIETSHIKMPR